MTEIPATFALLRLLADGEYHPGRKLAARLGASGAAVARHLRAIERLGLALESTRGRGVRLAAPLDLIDAGPLASRLCRTCPVVSVDVLDECASTNTALLARARAGAAHGLVLACEHQTGGRGRRGSAWHSGVGSDLTFSLLWRFHRGAGGLAGLSLAVGVALGRALEEAGCAGIRLKWPNDLLLHGRKLGGVLIETAAEDAGRSSAVIGVGLNVSPSPRRDAAVDQPAIALGEALSPAPRRTPLLAALLEELARALELFAHAGFAAFRGEWLARHAWQGRQVELCVSGRTIAQGEALGVDGDGALLLGSARGVERVHSGDLSLAAGRLRERVYPGHGPGRA